MSIVDIVLDGVSMEFPGGVQAVRELSLHVAPGECLVLAGPSGCGKTTTLRLLAGLETPSAGTIRLAGKEVNGVPPWRRPVAMVFQRPALFPNRTVGQNLTTGLARRSGWFARWRRSTPADVAQVLEIARLLELEEVLPRYPAELSGGQHQRVALGRALLRQAPILLLDEPLGQLDAPLRLALRRQLHLLRGRFPATIVHVTHDADEALAVADRLAILHQGRLMQMGTATELLTRPAHRFVAQFCQRLALVEGHLAQEAEGWFFSAADGHWLIPGIQWYGDPHARVSLGLREECIRDGDRNHPSAGPQWTMDVATVEPGAHNYRVIAGRGPVTMPVTLELNTKVVRGQNLMVQWDWTNTWIFDSCGRTVGQVLPAG